MEKKGNIIIIEGPQGVGKSTMANFIRDNLALTNLYRLTGIKDKTPTGLEKSKKMYLGLVNYMESLEGTELNLVFDRTFFSEQVYSKLGYKEYDFTPAYKRLIKKLNELDYNIYFVVLCLDDISLFEKRLRRQHHQYQAFSVQNSINQQNEYLKLQEEIRELKLNNIQTIKIATDNFKDAYENLIKSIPILKEEGIVYNENID